MTDNLYVVEDIATSAGAIRSDPDGTDWLIMRDIHPDGSILDLTWSFSNGVPTSARGQYYIGNASWSVTITGVIENARGAAGRDDVAGNIYDNVLYGDPTRDGPGMADTLFGDAGNDTVYGGAGADGINGAGGNDRLFGDAGADSLYGGAGIDTIEGGLGADILDGSDDLGDTVSYRESDAGVRVSLTFGTATTGSGGHAAGDRIQGFTNVVGSAFDDRIEDTDKGPLGFDSRQYNGNTFLGGGGQDVLLLGGYDDLGYGGTGNDRLEGEEGQDRLWGEQGSDTLLGGYGSDRLRGGDGFDYLSGGDGNDSLWGGEQRDLLYGGDGADGIAGDGGNDDIFANAGNDRVAGGAGDDRIAGQAGVDRIEGGAGADTFLYFTLGEGGDRILDMAAEDRVELQLRVGAPALFWDDVGPLGAGGARLVDLGADVELQINSDADAAIEFRITFAGAGTVLQSQIEL